MIIDKEKLNKVIQEFKSLERIFAFDLYNHSEKNRCQKLRIALEDLVGKEIEMLT